LEEKLANGLDITATILIQYIFIITMNITHHGDSIAANDQEIVENNHTATLNPVPQ
jgi:hypothetical protein